MAYDFLGLSPIDFEDLVRDLVGRDLKVRFEAFAIGPDGGMDGRHSTTIGRSKKSLTVLQAKHLARSRVANLMSTMKRERKVIDKLAPTRYLLATSLALTNKNKEALSGVIGPALKQQSDIYAAGDLNLLLRRFPEVERTHIKLWLTSTVVLDRVVRASAHSFTQMTRDEIEAKLRLYVPNPSFGSSRGNPPHG